VLALVAVTGSLFGSPWQFFGTISPTASASSLDDDNAEKAVVPQPLLVAALLFALAVIVLVCPSPRDARVSGPRARAPPYC
jgi:hypothetical protein